MSDKFPASLLFFLILTPFLIQCVASKQEMSTLDLRMRTMDNRLVNMDKEITTLQNKAGESAKMESVDFMQKRQAILNDDTERLKADVLQLKAKLDESTHFYRSVKSENESLRKQQNEQLAQISALTEKINALEMQLAKTGSEIERIDKARVEDAAKQAMAMAKAAAERAAEAARSAAEKAAAAARSAAEKTARLAEEKRKENENGQGILEITPDKIKKKIDEGENDVSEKAEAIKEAGKDLYDNALSLFKQNDFKQAYNGFTDYINKNPTGSLIANSRFWLGDCLFNLKEYELAILEYQKVIADYPNHSKAPAALLKQGKTFELLDDNETAKIIYQKLLDDYPKSDQVAEAKKSLEKLKK